MINVKSLHSSWDKKKQIRAKAESVKSFEKEIKEETNRKKEEKRKQTEERQKRKEENRKKSEIVQQVAILWLKQIYYLKTDSVVSMSYIPLEQ